MSINSASDAKMFNQLCSSGKADSSQVKTTTAPVSSASPITGGLTTQTTIKTTYTSAYTQEELAALQKKDQGFFSSIGSSILSFFKNNFGAGCTVVKEVDFGYDLLPYYSPVNASLINKETEVISKMGDSSKTFSVYCIGNSSDWLGSSAGIKINIFNQSFNLSLGFKNIGISLSSTYDDNNATYVGCSASLSDLSVGCEVGNVYTEDNNSWTTGGNASVNGPLLFGALYGFPQGKPYGPPPLLPVG